MVATLTALLNPAVETENIRALLTTLATAEASVLAIVFSVTVVALQLVVTRYSARLTSLFVKEPLFRTTFALFVGAIAFNLLVVYLLPIQNSRLMNAVVGIAFALAAVSTFALYRFIRLMIQRSSPDDLISVLVERELAPDEYLPATVAAFNEIEVHPIRPLYRTIARAIELGEYQTAEQGIDGLRTVLTRTFEYLESEYSEEDADQYASAVSTKILTEYVPPILEQAYTHEQYDLVSDAVDDVEAVALDGLERDFTDVTEEAAEGLGDAFDAAPLTWEGNRLRSPVKESLLELTKVTASDADYSTFRAVFHPLNFQMKLLLRRRPDSNVTYHLVGDYYSREIGEIFEALVDRYGPAVRDQDINWISPTEGRKWTLPDEAEPSDTVGANTPTQRQSYGIASRKTSIRLSKARLTRDGGRLRSALLTVVSMIWQRCVVCRLFSSHIASTNLRKAVLEGGRTTLDVSDWTTIRSSSIGHSNS
ncbi:DUF2254 family protein [Halospeciosus flavus]|uniref:DUF2254 family protein n=1 Tax=Halospeciosus flavus TaxID=3032283 RepID=UPI003614DEA5